MLFPHIRSNRDVGLRGRAVVRKKEVRRSVILALKFQIEFEIEMEDYKCKL